MKDNDFKLNMADSQILRVLLKKNYYLTTTQVAKLAGVSWNTADKYLREAYKKGWINTKKRGNRRLWRAIPPR